MSVKPILKTLLRIKHDHPVYLVGGIVRDILLKKDTNDIDVASRNALGLARICARTFKGTFFPLDEENKIYRVVIQVPAGNKSSTMCYCIDFAELRGATIENDLELRDFTVDAMAVRLDGSWQIADTSNKLIDPSSGYKDLKAKTIRMVSKNIFKDDPLRLLRAFRLAAVLKFAMEKNTLALIKKQTRFIKRSAPERVREELLKILAAGDSAAYIKQLDTIGLLAILIPEIKKQKLTARDFYGATGVWTHTLSGLAHLDAVLPALKKYFPKHFYLLQKHLEQTLGADVTRKTVLKLAFLLHDFGKAETHTKEGKRSRFFGHELVGAKRAERILQRLHFSNKEIHMVKNIILNHMRPGNLSSLDEITDKAIYRYFRDLGEEGIDTLILSLADAFTTADTVITRKKQDIYPVDPRAHLRKVREIIARFYTHKKQIVPKNILNGSEIMTYFRLPEGPHIGELIEALKEAQAQKLVQTKKEAYHYLERYAQQVYSK